MITSNRKKLGDKKIKNKPGMDSNESRFGATDRELRAKKYITVPSINSGNSIKLEQGWCKQAKNRDVIKLKIGDETAIVEREDIEQALFYLSQGDELIKYNGPVIS